MRKSTVPQEKKTRMPGFTLVEIMIVILIILLMLQLGNINGLFRTRERSKLEGVAIQTIALIDAEKTHALLGKTENGKIVRKRHVTLTAKNQENAIKITSEINLVEDEETQFGTVPKEEKTFSLAGMKTFFYECPTTGTTPLTTEEVILEFTNDEIGFSSATITTMPYHLVLLFALNNASHEIHIDRRTGLTYEENGPGPDVQGNWPVRCN